MTGALRDGVETFVNDASAILNRVERARGASDWLTTLRGHIATLAAAQQSTADDQVSAEAVERVLALCDKADADARYYGREWGGITVAQVREALAVPR